MELTHQLIPMLRTLRLSGILETLEVRNRQAVEGQTSFVEFLTLLLQDEVERRAQSTLRLRLRRAALDPSKTLESFDFGFNPKLNKAQLFDLATCAFVERHETILVYGPTGTGKSHLAQALAHEACRRGFEVLWVPAAKMLAHLAGGRMAPTTSASPAMCAPISWSSINVEPSVMWSDDPSGLFRAGVGGIYSTLLRAATAPRAMPGWWHPAATGPRGPAPRPAAGHGRGPRVSSPGRSWRTWWLC